MSKTTASQRHNRKLRQSRQTAAPDKTYVDADLIVHVVEKALKVPTVKAVHSVIYTPGGVVLVHEAGSAPSHKLSEAERAERRVKNRAKRQRRVQRLTGNPMNGRERALADMKAATQEKRIRNAS